MMHPGANVTELRAATWQAEGAAPVWEATFGVPAGRVSVLRGDEGSGALAALRLATLGVAPQAGEVWAAGRPTHDWTEAERAEFRANHFGVVHAAPFLLPALTVLENVAMPLFRRPGSLTPAEAAARCQPWLAFAGIGGREQLPAGELCLEEQYTVALVRALVHEPSLLAVEEPEPALGEPAWGHFTQLLRRAATERGVAVLAVLRPGAAVAWADYGYDFSAGRQTPVELPHPTPL